MQEILLFLQQQWPLTLSGVFILVVLLLLEFIKQKRGAKQLTPSAAVQLINHQNAVVVDIRPTTSFNEGHIVGSLSLPLTELDKRKRILEKSKSQPIILVCNTGLESPRISEQLATEGFSVHILAGGLRAWRDENLPLVK